MASSSGAPRPDDAMGNAKGALAPHPALARRGCAMKRNFALTTMLAALAAAGCHGERDEARRADVARVGEAVRKLREAPNAEKDPLLKALRGIPCSNGDACDLRRTCVDAYALEERALDSLKTVRRATASASEAEPVPSAAATLLSEASRDLERAKDMATACADQEGALRRKYSL